MCGTKRNKTASTISQYAIAISSYISEVHAHSGAICDSQSWKSQRLHVGSVEQVLDRADDRKPFPDWIGTCQIPVCIWRVTGQRREQRLKVTVCSTANVYQIGTQHRLAPVPRYRERGRVLGTAQQRLPHAKNRIRWRRALLHPCSQVGIFGCEVDPAYGRCLSNKLYTSRMSSIDIQKCSRKGNKGQRVEGNQVTKAVIEPVHLYLCAVS